MMDHEIWKLEERLWLDGADVFDANVDPNSLMVFPAPAGVIPGEAIQASLQGAPRWKTVSMSETAVGQPSAELVVLAYLAEAEREGQPPYRAYCSSTYHRSGDRWMLVQHQQTPL